MSARAGRAWSAGLAAWWSFVVVDFLVHAVILATWWRATEAYWLSPRELFRSIPVAYASFGLYCAVLTWLLMRLHGDQLDVRAGLRCGGVTGIVFGVISALEIHSIVRVPNSFLLVSPVSMGVESAAAGAAAAWVLGAQRSVRRLAFVFCLGVLVFLVGVVVQNSWMTTPAERLLSRP